MHKCEYACTHTSICTHIHISAMYTGARVFYYLLNDIWMWPTENNIRQKTFPKYKIWP